MTMALLSALTPAMAARGLHWESDEPDNGWFRRRTPGVPGVRHVLQLLFVDHSPDIVVEPQLAVRHDQIESIFHRTSGFPPEDQADTPTVGGDLHELIPGAPVRFEIRGVDPDGDAATAAAWLLGAMEEVEGYWARFSDLAEIDSELNSFPDEYSPNRPLPWLRCSTGLIVAKLVGRPQYDQLEAGYRRQLTVDNNGFYLGRFTALAEDLRSEHA